MDHSKRKNIYIIVFVVTTIIAACVAVYFGIKENERKGDLQIANKDIEEYKSKLEQATVNKGEVTTPSTDKKDCEEKVVTKSTPVGFNKDKCLNKKQGQSFSSKEDGLSVSTDGSVTIYLTEENKETYGNFGEVKAAIYKDIKITGLSGKVVEAILGQVGQSASGEVAFFLMADGTVEYMPMVKAVTSGTMKSYGKLPTLSSIVKFVQGSSEYTYEGQPAGGARDTFAINANGDFYSISNILNDNKLID